MFGKSAGSLVVPLADKIVRGAIRKGAELQSGPNTEADTEATYKKQVKAAVQSSKEHANSVFAQTISALSAMGSEKATRYGGEEGMSDAETLVIMGLGDAVPKAFGALGEAYKGTEAFAQLRPEYKALVRASQAYNTMQKTIGTAAQPFRGAGRAVEGAAVMNAFQLATGHMPTAETTLTGALMGTAASIVKTPESGTAFTGPEAPERPVGTGYVRPGRYAGLSDSDLVDTHNSLLDYREAVTKSGDLGQTPRLDKAILDIENEHATRWGLTPRYGVKASPARDASHVVAATHTGIEDLTPEQSQVVHDSLTQIAEEGRATPEQLATLAAVKERLGTKVDEISPEAASGPEIQGVENQMLAEDQARRMPLVGEQVDLPIGRMKVAEIRGEGENAKVLLETADGKRVRMGAQELLQMREEGPPAEPKPWQPVAMPEQFPQQPVTGRRLAGVEGTEITATGADPNVEYRFKPKVVELDDLVPSHTDALLRDTGSIDRGSPIVGSDAIVESGNGRVLALRRARELYPERFEDYRQGLLDRAGEYGIPEDDVLAMKNPVLVRERVTDVDRPAFMREANEQASMSMSAYEDAIQDAGRVSDTSLSGLKVGEDQSVDQALRAPANRDLVREFIGKIPENERARVLDAKGELSQQGLERLKGALFAKTYPGEAGRRLARTMIESLDSDVRNIENALYQTLPEMARAETLVRRGERAGGLGIGEDLAKSVDMLARLRERGMSVKDFLSQRSLVRRELNPQQERLLGYLDEIGRSRKKVKQFISEYAASVDQQANPAQGTLTLGEKAPTKGELIENAQRRVREQGGGGDAGQRRSGDGASRADSESTQLAGSKPRGARGSESGGDAGELTQLPEPEYFASPSGDRKLPPLLGDTVDALGKEAKPLVLKENIVYKNRKNHPDLGAEDNTAILQGALYEPTRVIQSSASSRPDNWLFVKENGKHRSAVVEMSSTKGQYEVVNWHYLDDRTLGQKIAKAEREGGRVLITQAGKAREAGGLSALASSQNDYTTSGGDVKLTGARAALDAEGLGKGGLSVEDVASRYKGASGDELEQRFIEDYRSNGLHDADETQSEYLRRIFCNGLG
jgi:hypothetical protein